MSESLLQRSVTTTVARNLAHTTITSPKITADSSATDLQSKPILDLVAFGVAHADQERIAGDQAELKRLMLAALPLWTTLKGGYDVTDLSVQTTFGQFGVANFGSWKVRPASWNSCLVASISPMAA